MGGLRGEGRGGGRMLGRAANHQHRQAHADQAQRALTGIADYREDFYYREAFSLA
jgi:hypothetical protein